MNRFRKAAKQHCEPLVKRWQSRLRATFAHTDAPELEQALIRLVAGLMVLFSFLWYTADGATFTSREWYVLSATGLYVLLSIGLLVRVYLAGGISPGRRFAGMWIDNCGITFFR